ncbi:succinate dehydrogenase, hydrophobic membrane anchor protein [Ectothiorhodospira mobilis]|uniref:succinate dehydrogenase, hydrophobic membrane anchor protein n=1 Tax=Ectothiorhodospira mobilis TaxID=195064 RepID=UPI0019037887|nr:succinate dehydrogenase, hydrophobic membrane anchor protein [Ectothiorhodospira mobilis]MBK1690569.1 succinate dehydrogenase, hydrophobic membrane anchor protein [Ectothiorhodospira mobilis]
MSSLRSPLGRALGQGSTGEGAHHWWLMRLSSVAMVPLMLWLMFSLAALAGADHATVTAWLAFPLNTTLMILAVATLFFHANMGLQVIIEDYVHHAGLKFTTLIAVKFALILLAVTGIVAILRIAFGS